MHFVRGWHIFIVLVYFIFNLFAFIYRNSFKDWMSDLPWCQCRVCFPMETEQENVCCKKRQCITSYRTFNNICLNRDILEVCIKARCDIRAVEFNFSMESFRKAAYRQFALWKYGKLGRGNRRVLPACVVRLIRQAYPSADGRYMGFRIN